MLRMTDTQTGVVVVIPHEPALKILDYAERVGVDHRTVREWLRKGLLPDAYKDGRGRWWIPATAQKLETAIAPRVDSPPDREGSLMALPQTTVRLVPEFIPLYMPVDEAAPLLGVTAYQIRMHPDVFDVVPWGENGAWIVPVRRLLGLTS